MDIEDDENYNPNLPKDDESDVSSDDDFDGESSEKPSKSKKGKVHILYTFWPLISSV